MINETHKVEIILSTIDYISPKIAENVLRILDKNKISIDIDNYESFSTASNFVEFIYKIDKKIAYKIVSKINIEKLIDNIQTEDNNKYIQIYYETIYEVNKEKGKLLKKLVNKKYEGLIK